MDTLRASKQGLEIVDRARKQKGWNRQSPAWYQAALTTQPVLKRFWQGKAIQLQNFINICQAVGIQHWEEIVDRTMSIPALPPPVPIADWDEAPDVSVFYGRAEELITLKQWIVRDRCQLVTLLGMGGIGKTTLSVQLAKQIQGEFEYMLWRSLRNAPPVLELLSGLLQFLSNQQEDVPENVKDGVSRLRHYLQKHRCLIILDDMEAILRSGDRAGHYLEGYEGYGELLRRIGSNCHRSCIVLTSREQLEEIALSAGKNLPVRTLQLRGLQEDDAREIFRARGFSGSEDKLADLIQLYSGNPSALKIVATHIQKLFNGNVSLYLIQGTLVLGDSLRQLLHQQFKRLSDLEKEIVYWLAIERQPVAPAKLQEKILLPRSRSELLESLESLERRAFIEQISEEREALFTLQPVVMKYVVSHFVEQVCDEIRQVVEQKNIEKFTLFRSHSLNQQQERGIEATKTHLITVLVKNKLHQTFQSENAIADHMSEILSMLEGRLQLEVGYIPQNIFELLREFKITSDDCICKHTVDLWQKSSA